MQLVVALATLIAELTPEEALWAATRGGARALQLDNKGWIKPGSVADLVMLEADSYLEIPYRPGTDLVRMLRRAVENRAIQEARCTQHRDCRQAHTDNGGEDAAEFARTRGHAERTTGDAANAILRRERERFGHEASREEDPSF